MVEDKINHSIDVYTSNTSDPTQIINIAANSDNDDKTIITSNRTQDTPKVHNVHPATNKSMAETA